ncbi:hypothetical protein QQ73_02805, partial [Candidatus Endoriftia persephone str. Guaymas]|nr:hypothetical protein [Candidatus Endoriftia persephone str. Guaymas]
LPTFEHCSPSANQLELIYYSKRPLGDLAHGLIEGCAAHFGDTLSIEREELLVEEGTSAGKKRSINSSNWSMPNQISRLKTRMLTSSGISTNGRSPGLLIR